MYNTLVLIFIGITEGKSGIPVRSVGNDSILRRAGEPPQTGGEQQEITHVGADARYDKAAR